MESRILIPAVALVLALAFTSGDALKCYECMSVGSADDECSGEMLKSVPHMPIECSVETMRAWHIKMQRDATLNHLSNVFEVHPNTETQYRDPRPPMACIKMNLRVDNQPVTLRTCQTAKTAEVDPCKATRDKISRSYQRSASVEYCGMCESDKCNGSYALSPKMVLAILPLIGTILMSLVYSSA